MYYPTVLPTVIQYRAKTSPFRSYLFSDNLKDIHPLTWWSSIKNLDEAVCNLVEQLHTAVASSGDIERLFSCFGLVHSKIRNRLGPEKASKLVTVFKELNSGKTVGNDEEEDEVRNN